MWAHNTCPRCTLHCSCPCVGRQTPRQVCQQAGGPGPCARAGSTTAATSSSHRPRPPTVPPPWPRTAGQSSGGRPSAAHSPGAIWCHLQRVAWPGNIVSPPALHQTKIYITCKYIHRGDVCGSLHLKTPSPGTVLRPRTSRSTSGACAGTCGGRGALRQRRLPH